MKISDFQIHDTEKLDLILTDLVEMILRGQQNDPEGFGRVAAAVLDNDNRVVPALNHIVADSDERVHAERAAIDKYREMYGEIPAGSIIITTLSPCSEHNMDERYGESCSELINESSVKKVYCGYVDPTQLDSPEFLHKRYHLRCTRNKKLEQLCQAIAQTFL